MKTNGEEILTMGIDTLLYPVSANSRRPRELQLQSQSIHPMAREDPSKERQEEKKRISCRDYITDTGTNFPNGPGIQWWKKRKKPS